MRLLRGCFACLLTRIGTRRPWAETVGVALIGAVAVGTAHAHAAIAVTVPTSTEMPCTMGTSKGARRPELGWGVPVFRGKAQIARVAVICSTQWYTGIFGIMSLRGSSGACQAAGQGR